MNTLVRILIVAFSLSVDFTGVKAQRLLGTTVQDLFGDNLPPVRPLPPDQTTRTPIVDRPSEVFTVQSWAVDCQAQYVSPEDRRIWPEAVSRVVVDFGDDYLVEKLDNFLARVMAEATEACVGGPSQAGQSVFNLPAAFHVSVEDCAGCGWRFQATFDPVLSVWKIYDNQYVLKRLQGEP
jgi:hypothetical protein